MDHIILVFNGFGLWENNITLQTYYNIISIFRQILTEKGSTKTKSISIQPM